MIGRLLIATLGLAASLSGLSAQPLYLGEQEVDTGDRSALEAITRHCGDLAARSAPADVLPPVLPSDDAETGSADEADAFAGTMPIEALASDDDDEAEAAGEGTGSGVPARGGEGGEDGDGDGSPLALGEITLDHCKAAGIVF